MVRLSATVVLLVGLAVPAAAAAEPATIGGFDPATGQWHLTDAGGATQTFFYGNPADVPFTGDWDCDGVDTPGLYRRSDGFVYLRNSNTQGIADVEFFFGDPGDLPLAGDFDGDGCDTVSLYRPSESRVFVHNALGNDQAGLGAAVHAFTFGDPGDEPFAADFDGDGVDEVGLHRDTTGLVYFRWTLTAGPADITFIYGDPADVILAADWTGDGVDTVAAYRPSRGRFLVSHVLAGGAADEVIPYAAEHWLPVAGRFGLASEPTGRRTLVISGAGDVNTSPGYGPNRGAEYAWSGLGGVFLEDDLTVVNLECVPSLLGSPWPKTFTFRCDLDGLAVMRDAGVEVVSQANNHSIDYGHQAMLDGRARLLAEGIATVGSGKDAAEASAPAFFEIGGWRVAVLGFTSVISAPSWVAGPSSPGHASAADVAGMTAAVRAAAADADLVVVAVHWGTERKFTPDPEDVAAARALIDAGADVIFGHHPHVLQPLDLIDGRPIFYSLGNFVWHSRPPGNATAVAEVVVTPDGRFFPRLLPVRITDTGHPVLLK